MEGSRSSPTLTNVSWPSSSFPDALRRQLTGMDPATREFLETEPVNLRDRPRKRAGIIPSGIVQKLIIGGLNFVKQHSTFFRVHATAFTVIPLIFAGIFYASNGRFHISFLDSLFLCYSAMTVTGLSTINLSTLTTWQQFILYFLMTIVSSWMDGGQCRV